LISAKGKIKTLFSFLGNLVKRVFHEVFFYTPFFVLLYIAIHFTIGAFFSDQTEEQYKILFEGIGITGILSSLSLRASASTQDEKKKHIFYESGERLFHSILLFSVATVLKFSFTIIDSWNVNEYLITGAKVIILVPGLLFFNYGILYSMIALVLLHKALFKGWEKPLDYIPIRKE